VTIVLPWDLDSRLAAFPKTPQDGQLLVLETRAKLTALPFHRQKLTLVLSALRHFVQERRAAGFHVEHRVSDDYATAVHEFAQWAKPAELHVIEPREWAIHNRFRELQKTLPLTIHNDGGPGGHFLITREDFKSWAGNKPHLRMHDFYVMMRKRFNLLLDLRGQPEGGQWSFDADNRHHARDAAIPAIAGFAPDELTQEVMRWVAKKGQWGKLEGFSWPVTREQAVTCLDTFLNQRFADFGRYEDAIRSDAPYLFHSLLSAPLNLGLLHPLEIVDAAMNAYRAGKIALASAEGFLRQIIGWREFIRGVYWHLMPNLREANQLYDHRPLPDFFWQPEKTPSQCLREALQSVHDTGYTHHIQRLMVICNYATLAGLNPRAVSHWFWAAFVDAYEWVELPNVVGMAMWGTSTFTTKPYIASAAYIKRMSGLPAKGRGSPANRAKAPCARCRFDPDQRTGPNACPYNAMYWDFIERHRAELETNPRMRNLTRNLDRMSREERDQIRATAEAHRASLKPYDPPWPIDEDAG
jgi:deoxyribodipyrimidine photolyase-related protein